MVFKANLYGFQGKIKGRKNGKHAFFALKTSDATLITSFRLKSLPQPDYFPTF